MSALNRVIELATQLNRVNGSKQQKGQNKFEIFKDTLSEIIDSARTIQEEAKVQADAARAIVLEEVEELKKKNSELQAEITGYSKIKSISTAFANKLKFTSAFYDTIEASIAPYKITGGFIGSFNRQLLELPFALAEGFKTKGYGQSNGHDMDFIIMDSDNYQIRQVIAERLNKFAEKTQIYMSMYHIAPEKIPAPKIGPYTLVEIRNVTLTTAAHDDAPGRRDLVNIPHYLLKFVDENNISLEVDLLAWAPSRQSENLWPSSDFDVNSLMMNNSGMVTRNGTNFMSALSNIANKEAECFVNFDNLTAVLTPGQGYTRAEKIPYLQQIAFFMSNRIKLFAYGYKKFTNNNSMIDFSVEEKEDCPITTCSPPYIKLHLDCKHENSNIDSKHEISVMAYLGIIKQGGGDYSEAISCPMCRADLKFKLIKNPVEEIVPWTADLPVVYDSPKDIINEPKDGANDIFSEISEEFIRGIVTPPSSESEEERPLGWANMGAIPHMMAGNHLPNISRSPVGGVMPDPFVPADQFHGAGINNPAPPAAEEFAPVPARRRRVARPIPAPVVRAGIGGSGY
jgi:hypothetical protein